MSQQYQAFRTEIDRFMKTHPQSPLASNHQDGFAGLGYYDPQEAWVITAPLDYLSASEPHIEMQTSTGDVRHYRRWATFQFAVDGQMAQLTIFSDPWGESLFLPFKDTTNGDATYGAGRYLDNHRPGLIVRGDEVTIDFNHAYNPYCAYSPAFSCPLPPQENWLAVPITAGEKKFKGCN